jgi:integrase
MVRRAYTVILKDGTVRAVPEQRRQMAGVSNAEINRELTILKRIFSLAMQAGKLLHRPHVPLLRENNTRTGFFELEQFESVVGHLPAPLRPVIEFAYITGWRIDSEILPLEWRQVDFKAGEVRLEAGTTKNRDGRVFPLTDDLRRLLDAQQAEHLRLKKAGQIEPWVFFRMVAETRGGLKHPKPIRAFTKAWKKACLAAGCPGRIPHDLRRTAIRNMVRRGVPERVAMTLTGHKTRSVFERYNIVSDGDLRTAAEQLRGLTGIQTIAQRKQGL